MTNWKDIKIDGVNKIDKVVAEFHVWATEKVPYGKFKVRILERAKGGYFGIPDIMVKDQDGIPDGTSGAGSTVEEALEDTVKAFLQTLEGKGDLTEEDFEWLDPHDF